MHWFDQKKIKQPTLFVSYGWDQMSIEPGELRSFLKQSAEELKPQKIVALSSKWKSAVACVGADEKPQTIHDMTQYDHRLSQVDYTPPGDALLADQIRGLWVSAGISCRVDFKKGIDSSIWAPLRLMWPEAHIPVVPLTLAEGADARAFFKAGQALRELRGEGVMFVSCGQCLESAPIEKALPRQTPSEPVYHYLKKVKELLAESGPAEIWIEPLAQLLKQAEKDGLAKHQSYSALFFHLGLSYHGEAHQLGHCSTAYGVYGNLCHWIGDPEPSGKK